MSDPFERWWKQYKAEAKRLRLKVVPKEKEEFRFCYEMGISPELAASDEVKAKESETSDLN